MLTFRALDDVGNAAVRIIADTEQEIINDMARRISKLDGVTASTNWQATRLELLGTEQEKILQELSKMLNVAEKKIIELFDEASTRTLETDNRIYQSAGYKPVALAQNHQLQQIVRAGLVKTQGAYVNLTGTTANTALKQFGQALDLAYSKVVSGGFSYQQAVKDGIRVLSKNGIASIEYPSGHTDYMDVAFRRATLTGINQTCAEIQIENARQMGCDLMELTAHHSARPTHSVWQGHIVSLSGAIGYLSLHDIGYGEVTGFKGANCRHDWFPFFEGLSEHAYSPEKLREYNNKAVSYNGEEMNLYDATQKQRYFERQIRRWKRESSALECGGSDNSTAKNKVQEWQARQRDLIKQTGLRRDYFRERGGKQNLA